MLDPLTLKALTTLAEHGSFSISAHALGVSRVKLTRLIQQAEQRCGFSIFDRSRRLITPTIQGRRLLESCDEFSAAGERFQSVVDDIREQYGGLVTVGCGPLSTHTVVGPLLQAFLQRHPEAAISVDISAQQDPVRELRSGQLDLFIGDLSHTVAFDDIDVMVLHRHDIVFAARPRHRVFRAGPYTLAQIIHYPLALPHLHRYWRYQFDAALKRRVVPLSGRVPQVESDDYQLLIALAANTELITAGTGEAFADAFAAGSLRAVPMAETLRYNICAARRQRSLSPLLDTLWSALQQRTV